MRFKKGNWIVLFLIIGHLLLIPSSHAGVTGKIAGRVIDSNTGEPLPGANVMLKGVIREGTTQLFSPEKVMGSATDMNGEYFIINIPPGTYVLETSYIGYNKQTFRNIKVSTDHTTRQDFKLVQTALDVGQEVVVTAEREMIRKDLTASAVSVSSEEIEMLPVRSVGDVLELQAGVVRDAGGALHIRGGRSSEITYLVDGIQVIDPLSRASGLSIDNQAIQELQAITGTFNAEYGQALSGVVNIVTKQGSENFRFNITGYFGDHLSYDEETYSIMDNVEWANAAARALTFNGRPLFYDFSDAQSLDDILVKKTHLKKKTYLTTYNPLTNLDFQFNLSGPIPYTRKKVTYFVSGRFQDEPSYTYGKRYFMPWGYQSPARDTVNTFESADNELTPLGWFKNLSLQSKLFYRPIPSMNFSYGLYLNDFTSQGGSWYYKYVPDATSTGYTNSQTHIVALNHTLSSKTFYELKVSYYQKNYKSYLYEDPFDYRYMPTKNGDIEKYVYDKHENDPISLTLRSDDFTFFGNDVGRSQNDVSHYSVKFDMTSQITKRHLLKWGVEGRTHDLFNDYYELQFDETTYRPYIPNDSSSAFHQKYHYKPDEFSAYLQDKIEFQELIINLGIRYDYFNSDGTLLSDPAEPELYDPYNPKYRYVGYDPNVPQAEWGRETTPAERSQYWYKRAKAKQQISPRIGLSFPITEKGVIHFSYGHFFQTPQLSYLYENPKFWVDLTKAGVSPRIGNADINAERTVMYEIGLQQGLWENLFLHVTGFYRDIRDWVGISPAIDTYRGTTYHKYINNDHATVKGITLSGQYRQSQFAINLDYTYMVAKGTYSNPDQAYNSARSQEEPLLQLISLDWDQRHSLNVTTSYNYRGWNASLISSLNTGLPYTPSFARGESTGSSTQSGLRENSEVRPTVYNLDLRVSKRIKLGSFYTDVLLNVFNLLDTRNPRNVYSDTGRPDYTFEGYTQIDRDPGRPDVEISNVAEYYQRPGNYYAPRFIQLGLSFGL
ncbi:TonB-dependent receptor [candidate division KSB1 bacterium]|nr:TonB-dependent receptor [candidate division KSB1 bacterium]